MEVEILWKVIFYLQSRLLFLMAIECNPPPLQPDNLMNKLWHYGGNTHIEKEDMFSILFLFHGHQVGFLKCQQQTEHSEFLVYINSHNCRGQTVLCIVTMMPIHIASHM